MRQSYRPRNFRPVYLSALLATTSWLAACGGGSGGGSDSGGGLAVTALWEQGEGAAAGATLRAAQQTGDGGFGPELPASVVTVRFLFRSDDGSACCLAVDPDSVPRDASTGQRLLVLADLPAGPGTLTISGYPTDFAPSDGVATICGTDPANTGQSCDGSRDQSASFASDPQPVNIVAGSRSDAGDILIPALPFVVPGSLNPAPGTSASNPVEARFVVADAVTGIEQSSVELEISQNGAAIAGSAPGLTACSDATSTPCSDGGSLGVSGFAGVRPSQTIPGGATSFRVLARNRAAQSRSLDFAYQANVIPPPPTATSTPPPSATATNTRQPTSTSQPTATRTNTRRPPTATNTSRPTSTRTPTPTATPATPTRTPTPSRRFDFVGAETFPISGEPSFLASGDLNEDGRDDLLIVSAQSNELTLLFGSDDSGSRFNSGTVQSFGRGLGQPLVGDVNGDDHDDVIVPGERDGGVWILIGDGTGNLATAYLVDLDAAASSVAIADFDAASNADLVVTDRDGTEIAIGLNEGQTTPRFRAGPRILVGNAPRQVATLDMNDDGALDIAVTHGTGTGPKILSILLFERVVAGLPEFGDLMPYEIAANPDPFQLADMNDDGNLDFVMLSQSSGLNETNIDVILNQGDGTLGERRSFLAPCPFFTGGLACRGYSLTTADFDRNGNVDVAVSLDDPRLSSNTDAVELFTGRPDGGVVAESSFTTAKRPLVITAGDFNGDELSDIGVTSVRDLTVQAFINVSTSGQ